ncbi:MAG: VacJ family lipoprotein [Robiginitomaculum sp.]|nr:MAG: VacJ family lipoprotein [Robiginitomaculum sp.]
MSIHFPLLFLSLLGLSLSGCASTASTSQDDPFEPVNRAVYDFNKAVDKVVLAPVSKAYHAITPKPARNGIRNFLRNLKSPVILANDLLQGEWKRAGNTASRFVVNTTVGVGGLFDVAKKEGISPHKEDFGQTMATYGIKPGPYIVLPLLGPTSLRDTVGRLPDHFMTPLAYTQFDGKNTFTTVRRVLSVADKRARSNKSIKKLRKNAFDEYTSVRDLYWQTRKDAVANGKAQLDDLPEFDISDARPLTTQQTLGMEN